MKSKKLEWLQSGILQIMESVGAERRLCTPQEFYFNRAVSRGGGWGLAKMGKRGKEVQTSSYTINKSQG